jgi:hypothetical protein
MIMNVLRKNLLFLAAATTIWAAAMQPGDVSAQSSGIGGDGDTRLLWRGTDGSISVWKLNPSLAVLGGHIYGPYYGWQPVALTTANNNFSYVLWRDTNNFVSLWAIDANLNFAFNKTYGPFYGWVAETLSVDTNGNSTLRLIWRSSTGQVSVWFLDQNLNFVRNAIYGPFFGWNPGPVGSAGKAGTSETADPQAAAAMKSNAGAEQQSMPK